jgi:hypothetical protein
VEKVEVLERAIFFSDDFDDVALTVLRIKDVLYDYIYEVWQGMTVSTVQS